MAYMQTQKQQELDMDFKFTGMWERSHRREKVEEMKASAKTKYKGYKTRVVRKGDGVSIYVEKRWFNDEAERELRTKIAEYDTRTANALKAYKEALVKLAEEQSEYIARLEELEHIQDKS